MLLRKSCRNNAPKTLDFPAIYARMNGTPALKLTTKQKIMKNTNVTNEIKAAKSLGFSVKIQHFRLPASLDNGITKNRIKVKDLQDGVFLHEELSNAHARGGKTRITVSRGDNEWEVESFCSPKDNFSKKIGLLKAWCRMKGDWGWTDGPFDDGPFDEEQRDIKVGQDVEIHNYKFNIDGKIVSVSGKMKVVNVEED